ncbi:hypothetical protein F3K36_11605 [Delftia sp. BR1]|nr:hypothetical protein F3K36_11605 [Delftia sp. BR1]
MSSYQIVKLALVGLVLHSAPVAASDNPSVPVNSPSLPGAPEVQPDVSNLRLIYDKELALTPPVGFSPQGALRSTAILPKLAKLGPLVNKYGVEHLLKKAFSASVDQGASLMKSTGQRGMLVSVDVLEQSAPGDLQMLQLHGAGSRLVGVGPTAQLVALSELGKAEVSLPIPRGAQFTSNSGYIWLEPKGSGYQVTMYPRSLEVWAGEARASNQLESYAGAEARAIDDYLIALRKTGNDAASRREVDELVAARQRFSEARRAIETTLQEELLAQERRAAAMAGLNALSMALSLGSAVAMYKSTAGPEAAQALGDSVSSYEDLRSKVEAWGTKLDAAIQASRIRQDAIRLEAGKVDAEMRKIGRSRGMEPEKIPSIRLGPKS